MIAKATIPFIQRIELNNLLSFGPKDIGLDLLPLNVLIGPNGSGKSNFIEAIALMRAAPSDYRDCLLYTSPSPRDRQKSRMPSSA